MATAKASKRVKTQRIIVPVDEDVIETATRGNSHTCAAANAIRKLMPSVQRVSADVYTIAFSDPRTQQRYYYRTPPRVQQMIVEFDAGGVVRPFTFELRRPERVTAMRHDRYDTERHTKPPNGMKPTGKRQTPQQVGGRAPFDPGKVARNLGKDRVYGLRSLAVNAK